MAAIKPWVHSETTGHKMTLPPLSLYVHIPWCVKKCPYCDFNSHELKDIDETAYLSQLEKDLLNDQHWVQGRKLRSLFFGGGTPSLFSAQAIAHIIRFAERQIGFENNVEITLEANPGTTEQEKFSGFFDAGVNRLSIGIQSFNDKHLKHLGRIHTSAEALKAIEIAKKVGFSNINGDIMYGLPQQTPTEAHHDLQQLLDLDIPHISWYQLTIEPNTHFYRQPPVLPIDDILEEIQTTGTALLTNHSFLQYEVSAFCRDQQHSSHNMNYWEFGDYIGIGAGAHGKFTDVQQQSILRRYKTRLPEHYLAAPSYKEKSIPIGERPLEFMMNALRLKCGVPAQYFNERTGLPLSTIMPSLQKLQEQGLLQTNNGRLLTSSRGFSVLNSVLDEFT